MFDPTVGATLEELDEAEKELDEESSEQAVEVDGEYFDAIGAVVSLTKTVAEMHKDFKNWKNKDSHNPVESKGSKGSNTVEPPKVKDLLDPNYAAKLLHKLDEIKKEKLDSSSKGSAQDRIRLLEEKLTLLEKPKETQVKLCSYCGMDNHFAATCRRRKYDQGEIPPDNKYPTKA